MKTPLTPLDFLRRARSLYGEREAVVDGERRLSYAQFLDRCSRFAAVLRSWGLEPGDRIAYIAPNTLAHLEGHHAVPMAGGVIVPVNYRLTADDFAYIVDHSGSRVLCVDEEYAAAIDGIRERLAKVERFVLLGGERAGWLGYEALLASDPAPPALDPLVVDEDDLISLNYTSGTTSRPKGVMITHRNAWVNAMGTLAHIPLGPGDRYLWTLPMFHANGWGFVWMVTARGGTHVCLRRVAADTVFPAVARERITFLCAAPTVLIALASASAELRADVPRGVRLLTAGAPPAAVTIDRVERELGWRLTQVYGLTETAPFITVCEERPDHASLDPAARAAVKARQGVELVSSGHLRVVDERGSDVPRDASTVGEIVVRGNVVMKGYFADPEATARAFEGGWFHTGDAAVVHPDGYVEIRDRIKDVIISGGENISSVEVESTLLRHAAVQEVAVVGRPHPTWGEAPHAFVVLKAGATASEEDIVGFAREHLARFKAPKWVSFVGELPKTATGKIQKFVLRKGPAIAAQ